MTRRMALDILVVGPASRSTGGVAQYLHEQTARLADDIETRVHDIGTPLGEGPLWIIRSLLVSLIGVVSFPRRQKPDLVHVHSSHGFSFFRESAFVLWAAYVWRQPVVLHVHGSSFD